MNVPNITIADFLPLIPEIIVLVGAFGILMLDLFINERNRVVTHVASLVVLAIALFALVTGVGGHGAVLNNMFIRDTASDVMSGWIVALTGVAMVFAYPYFRAKGTYQGEISVLMLFATLGMMLLVSAGNMTMIYVALEMLALCSYALVVCERESPRGSEAGIKYFVLGALASGLLLYGMSLIYGGTKTLDLAEISQALTSGGANAMLVTGMVFVVVGIAFKFGAAPFHMWLPDVYDGAPAPITLFIGSAPKIAAFGMAYRMLEQGTGPLGDHWQLILAALACLSLAIGNLSALRQTNIKRLLAYSTVSHVGFLFIGLASGGPEGYAAALFYAITYAIMSACAFGVVAYLSRQGFEADQLSDYAGLSKRKPWVAFMMLMAMASMAGVPPWMGFWAKWSVLWSAVHSDMVWLAIVGIVAAVIGAFYYLKVIKVMYFDEVPEHAAIELRDDGVSEGMLTVLGVSLLVLGLFFDPIMQWCRWAFGA